MKNNRFLEGVMKEIYQSQGFDSNSCRIEGNTVIYQEKDLMFHEYYLDFNEKISTGRVIQVDSEHTNRGIGSRLVKAREDFCKKAGMEYIIIDHCLNDEFWKNRGYPLMDEEMQNRLFFLEGTRYKKIR